MFNTESLKELRNSAVIVRNALEDSIINSTVYAAPTIAQAIAVSTVCDEIVSNIDYYLAESEEYGARNLYLFLYGMDYLLRSIYTDGIGYYEVVLDVCDNVVKAHFDDMLVSLRTRKYYV